MYFDNKIIIGDADGAKVWIEPKMANRHGLIAGATGTGKTVTLKVLAESFSSAGVPVFLADVKGDLAGMCKPGTDNENLQERINRFNLKNYNFEYQSFPTTFWDIFSKGGIPLRTTISEMGPYLLARLMELNPTQTELLNVVFRIADDNQLLLIDTKDLKAMLNHVGENAKAYSADYGNIAKQSINTILRSVISLESMGGEAFFTEPALNISDWFSSENGLGMVNILDSRELMHNPTMYATFLLWLMSELFETLPEVGDMDKPRMVFFFDEAHLLFKDTPKAFRDKIEQVVKLIRSKGIGIYFITQNPKDIPDEILSQLGNKIQHALRAYTPNDEKAIKAAANSFRTNPDFDTKAVLTSLGTGEALISVLDSDGIPGIVQKCCILPPQSMMGGIAEEERQQTINRNNLFLKYQHAVDNDSAYEFFQRQEMIAEAEEKKAAQTAQKATLSSKQDKQMKQNMRKIGNSAAGTIGREIGNSIGKSVGGSFGKRLGGNLGASIGRSILGTFLK